MPSFVKAGDAVIDTTEIRRIDCERLVHDGWVLVEYVSGRTERFRGADAIDIVMRTCPSFFEGRRMRWIRHSWAIHNIVGHPVMQILTWLGRPDLGLKVHDATIPTPSDQR